VGAEWLIEHGYECYLADAATYPGGRPDTREEFRQDLLPKVGLEGCDVWAALAEGRLVGYLFCYEIDGAVIISVWKSDPAYLKLRPNNALIFAMTRYYLVERRDSYVTNGARNLFHPTRVGEFLENMGYRRCFGKLGVLPSTRVKLAVATGLVAVGRRMTKLPGRIGRLGRQLDAVHLSLSIARDCRRLDRPAPRTD
jgi:hypothetical protein